MVVVVLVRTWCNDDVSVDTVTRACTEFGWQNTWEQAPGVPATPQPSMTKNSSSSRAHLALNVRMDGARKRPVKRAKNPFSHRHRHKVSICPIFSTTCNCGNSAVSATTATVEPARPTQQGHRPPFRSTATVKSLWNLHSFLHCLDHRHLSLTTAGMSTTLSKNSRDETIFDDLQLWELGCLSHDCDCGACATNTTGTSTTFQKNCNCEISMDRNLHSFLHCLDHRHLSLTTAGMSTTCHAVNSRPAPVEPARHAHQRRRPPCQ